MIRSAPIAALVAALAACSGGEEQDAPPPERTATPVSAPTSDSSDKSGGEESGRALRYTSLAECPTVREDSAEMHFVEVRCDGPAGFALRISDFDARNDLTVIDPAGAETSLELSRIGGGGFSSIGDTAEWRGPVGGNFAPDALIVRYNVAEKPYPAPDTSYLLAIQLKPDPCVVSKVAPGPAQNAIARRRADQPGACIAGQ